MNLILFFRLILMSIFQSSSKANKNFMGEEFSYDNSFFYCPKVYAKDGFNVSLQINNNNYCSSENGYRSLGHTMEDVEFGFPSENEELLHKYSEMWRDDSEDFDVIGTVGSIPVSVLEKVFEKHGGIDWDKTLSIDTFNSFTK